MSMSVRDDASGLEYAGARGIGGLFPSLSSLARPRYLLMLAEIKRFHAAATRLLQTDADDADARRVPGPARLFPLLRRPLHDSARRGGVVVRRRERRCATRRAICSCSSSTTACSRCSARRRGARSSGGSANYVEAILNRVDEVRAGDPVTSVRRVPGGVQITTDATRVFDAAVIATHPDQALLMLAEPTDAERAVLGAIPYCTNHAQLHTDESVLPRHGRARASWNYLVTPNEDNVLVTYDVTRLMRLDGPAPLPRDTRRPRPRRPGDRACRDDLQPPDVHPGVGCRPTTSADAGR